MKMFDRFQLIGDPYLTETVRRPILPKTKRKRIRMKWRKKYPQFATVPKQEMYRIGDTFIAHPTIIDEISKQLVTEN